MDLKRRSPSLMQQQSGLGFGKIDLKSRSPRLMQQQSGLGFGKMDPRHRSPSWGRTSVGARMEYLVCLFVCHTYMFAAAAALLFNG